MRYFLVNKRKDPSDPRKFVETEYDYGGNTKRLPPDSRTEVFTDSEAQICLSRYQMAGVTVEYENEGVKRADR